MNEIKLTVKELRKIGIPGKALYFYILQKDDKVVYEITFRYKGKKYKTIINDYYLKGYKNEEELECVEVK